MKSLRNIFFSSLVIKLLVAALLPLSFDEAYYWVWSKNLQLSYFDHPPMVSWLFWLGQAFENLGSAVRWPAIILGHFIVFIWLLILKPFTAEKNIEKIWWMILLTPFLGLGSLIVTPDLPVLFFWTLSIYFVIQCFEQRSASAYTKLGIALGLGFCAKYHIVLFVPALLLYILLFKKWKDVSWKWVPLTIVTGLICCLPVLIWNYQNDFASFKFQIDHGLHGRTYESEWTWGYIVSQFLLVGPFVWISFFKSKTPDALRIVSVMSLFPFAFFLYTSTRGHVEANWPIMGYAGVIALTAFAPKFEATFSKNIKWWVTIYVLLATVLLTPSLRRNIEKLEEPFVYSNFGPEVKDFYPLYGTSYQMASSLWFEIKKPVYKLKGHGRFDLYDTLPGSQPTADKFYVVIYKTHRLPDWLYTEEYTLNIVKTINDEYNVIEVQRR